jgi:cell division septal protein FtsQ
MRATCSEMAWRRKRDPKPAATSLDDASSGDASVPGEMLTDDAVLDELSRVFAVGGTSDDADVVALAGPVAADVVAADAVAADTSTESASTGSVRSTISIIGDDLPDATYLDDELADDSSRAQPVFIDDDGLLDPVLPKSDSTRGIEPRIRQRRIGVKRSENRRRLWWLALAGVVAVVVVGVLALLGSSLFAVDRVTVTGNVYTDQIALDAVIENLTGTPVLLVDIDEVEAQVEQIPWVEEARVRSSFPNSASIEIRERTPVAAMMGADGQARVIDADARVLGLVDGQPVALVWISGPGTLDVAPGQFASIGYSSAASLVTKLTPDIRGRVDSMLVTPDGADLVLVLASESGLVEVRFGSAIGETAQIEKLVRLQRTLDDLGAESVTVIDVSTSQVTVR